MGAFTVYLLKNDYNTNERYLLEAGRVKENTKSCFADGLTTSSDTAIRQFIRLKKEDYQQLKVATSEFAVYYRESDNPNPWWRGFWDIQEILGNKSTDVLVVVPTTNAVFLVTHGHARYFINPSAIEYDFGLRTALNLLDEDKVRAVDLFSPSEIGMRTRLQAGKNVDAESYDIDIYNNLLKTVAGRVHEKFSEYFKNVSGADSIHFTFSDTPEELRNLLSELHSKYELDDYKKKGFDWVDNFVKVRDQALIAVLDDLLVRRVNFADTKLLLTFPESLDIDVAVFYKIHGIDYYDEYKPYLPELDIAEHYFPKIEGQVLKIDDLMSQAISACDVNTEKPIYKRKMYLCLYLELEYAGQQYFLESGIWYRVDRTFLDQIDKHIDLLMQKSRSIDFIYKTKSLSREAKRLGRHKELVFNQELAGFLSTSCEVQLLDCDPVDKIEVCDVLFQDGDRIVLLHNKYKYGSSALSHLFSQGYVSARALTRPEFRGKANRKIASDALKFQETGQLDRKKYTVVYGIISEIDEDGTFTLPIFSRINLEMFLRNLEMVDFSVELLFFRVDANA